MSLRSLTLVADGYFDGVHHRSQGPYAIRIINGRIDRIDPLAAAPPDAPQIPRPTAGSPLP